MNELTMVFHLKEEVLLVFVDKKQVTYNVTLLRICVIIVAVNTQQCPVCVVQLHINVNWVQILTVATTMFL
jgi:hypothetical protein